MKRLLIVSGSFRRKESPREPIRALDRFDGVVFRLLRRLEAEGVLKDVDILIITDKGPIWAHEKVPYWPPRGPTWKTYSLSKEELLQMRKRIIEMLRPRAGQYEEALIVVGRQMEEVLRDIGSILQCKIINTHGLRLGEKMAKIREWLARH